MSGRGIARLGDKTIGTCHCHTPALDNVSGTIVTASSDHTCDGFGVARLGDTILADCGHIAKIITSSSKRFVNNRGVARLGDLGGDDCYECTIVTASTKEFTD